MCRVPIELRPECDVMFPGIGLRRLTWKIAGLSASDPAA